MGSVFVDKIQSLFLNPSMKAFVSEYFSKQRTVSENWCLASGHFVALLLVDSSLHTKKAFPFSEYARKSAVNTCLSHEIYYKEAFAEGIDLTPEEKEAAEKAASDLCAGMTEIQLERTGLTEDIIYNLRYKQELAAKYARSLAERVDFTVYEDGPEVELSGNGDFFQDVVLPRHQVSINNDLVDNVNMGRVTVNLDQN